MIISKKQKGEVEEVVAGCVPGLRTNYSSGNLVDGSPLVAITRRTGVFPMKSNDSQSGSVLPSRRVIRVRSHWPGPWTSRLVRLVAQPRMCPILMTHRAMVYR